MVQILSNDEDEKFQELMNNLKEDENASKKILLFPHELLHHFLHVKLPQMSSSVSARE